MSFMHKLQEKFLVNFPPPQYLEVSRSAIVFSDHSIRLLSLHKGNKHPTYFKELILENGIIEMGQIKNEEALVKLLSNELAHLPTRFVNFSLPDEACYIFTSKVPVVSGKDISDSVEFILEENVPLPLSDTTFDFYPEKIERNGGYECKVVVVAASRSLVEKYYSVLSKAGFTPLLCLNESQATCNAVIPKNLDNLAVIVHVHTKSAGIYIANSNVVEFSSVVPINFKDSLDDEDTVVKPIKAEVEKAVNYWESKSNTYNGGIAKLPCFLCGEHRALKNLSNEISGMGDTHPIVANVWVNAFPVEEYIPEISFDDSLKFSPAIGLLV